MFFQARHKQTFVILHRYLGLTTAMFLFLAGLTGSFLAYYHEIDEWLNPHLFTTPETGTDYLPEAQLFAIASEYSQQSGGDINMMPLEFSPGRTLRFYVNGSDQFNRLFLNPYTGDIAGTRVWDDLTEDVRNFAGFIYKLHYTLWLPGVWGIWILGIIALIWTIDCFIALATTLPVVKVFNLKLFFKRWKQSYKMRWRSKGYTFHFLLHRAAGLWVWALLLIFAWSSVAFNLRDVYQPVTYSLLGTPPTAPRTGHELPPMDPDSALQAARTEVLSVGQTHGVDIGWERSLRYIEASNTYQYRFHSSRDVDADIARSVIYIDAHHGTLLATFWPTGQYASTTVTQWLYALHMGEVFSWPYQLLVCLLGLLVAYFSYSGVLIWWKKRSKRR